jgi:hypothetical protein
MVKRNNVSVGELTFTVKAVASKSKNASSGKIVVHANNCSKDIPAVIFSPEDAKELLEIAERAMSSTH